MNSIFASIAFASIVIAAQARAQDAELIEEGRRLFMGETFDGNGRTCGTCHPANNNFTIDPSSVRTLRSSDPLFRIPHDLEERRFLNQAIILENLDTFDNPGVMRGVPHTLALRTSSGRMGWSGDGSPGDGSLRSFATGAVIQHFPKTLNRIEGEDFRLPTPLELDALEAFQLSLGRQANPDIAALEFTDPTVSEGKDLFISSPSRNGAGRGCGGCHANGGTNDGQRDTGAADLPTAPACKFGFQAAGDGGEGLSPETIIERRELCGGKGQAASPNALVTFRGNRLFNVPTVVEAADTPPFFHNNAVETLEGAVAFYTSDTFDDSGSGAGNAFVLDKGQINAIGAFLRVLNAMENIRSSNAYAGRSIDPAELAPRPELVELAIAETEDAIEVLTKGPISLHPDAVSLLRDAQRELKGDRADVAISLQDEARVLLTTD